MSDESREEEPYNPKRDPTNPDYSPSYVIDWPARLSYRTPRDIRPIEIIPLPSRTDAEDARTGQYHLF